MPYIGVSPQFGVRRKHTYTATAGQTSFSGAGSEGATLSYTDSNFVDVYQNGVKLGDADYTSTSGTAIVLAQGASVDDLVEIIVFDAFSAADTVSKADGGTFDGNVTMAGTLDVTGNGTVGGTLAVTGNQTNTGNLTVNGAFTSQGIDDNASSTAMTIDSSGRVGIFESSPAAGLHITSTNNDLSKLRLGYSTSNHFFEIIRQAGFYRLGSYEDGQALTFGTSRSAGATTERMRIDADGALLISRTDQTVNSSNFGSALSAGNINTAKDTNGGGVVVQVYGNAGKAFIYGDGDIGNDNGTYSSFSDQSLKENIVDAKSQWADIKAVQVRNFNLIASPDLTQIGVVAQELEASDMGGLVEEKEHDNEGNKKKTVKLSVLHMKALKALQEAMTRIETLETENKTQATQIADLISRVTALEKGE